MYLQADMQLKEQALAKTTATQARVSRYRPPDRILAFLNTLQLFRQLRTHQRAILQEIEPLRSHCRNNPLAGIMPVIPPTELAASLCRQDAARLVSRRQGRRTATPGALNLPRP